MPETNVDQKEPKRNNLVFPSHVMTGAAGEFARTYSQYLEVPASFLYMSFLTLLGNIISDKASIESETKPQTRLYTIILGRSASERKSTAIIKTIDFFRSCVDSETLKICSGVGSAEGLANAFKNTMQLVLVWDEFKVFVQKAKIQSSILLPCVSSLFDLNGYESFTKNRAVSLDHVHLSILAASTVETYQTMFTSTFLDIGLLNRLFVVIDHAERKFAIPRMVPEEVKGKLGGYLQICLNLVEYLIREKRPYLMPIHPEAMRLFEKWYLKSPSSIFTKRLDTYGHRLMPLLAINSLKTEVDVETVKKVIDLLNYELVARREVDPVDCDNKIAALEERIRRKLSNGPLSKRELERSLNKSRCGIWLWETAIKNLIAYGEIHGNAEVKGYELGNSIVK